MLFVIMGHSIAYESRLEGIILSFHMPLFFVLSGVTMKRPGSLKEYGRGILKDGKRLLLPFIGMVFLELIFFEIFVARKPVTELARLFAKSILSGNNGHNPETALFVGAFWFICALFLSKLLYRLIWFILGKWKTIPCLLLFPVSILLVRRGIILPWYLDSIFICLLFLEVGNLFGKWQAKKLFTTLIGCLSLAAWSVLTILKGVSLDLNIRQYGYVSLLNALLGSLGIMAICVLLGKFRVTTPLAFVGKHSFLLLCIHQLENFLIVTGIIPAGIIHLSPVLGFIRMVLDILVLCIIVFISKSFVKNRTKRTRYKC